MSESQSRYSIVERLTSRKLEIMSSKAKLKGEVKQKDQRIAKLRVNFDNWKKDSAQDLQREERRMEIEIDRAIADSRYSQEQLKEKEKVFDEQIHALENALHSIEEISKTALTA